MERGKEQETRRKTRWDEPAFASPYPSQPLPPELPRLLQEEYHEASCSSSATAEGKLRGCRGESGDDDGVDEAETIRTKGKERQKGNDDGDGDDDVDDDDDQAGADWARKRYES